MSTKIRRLSLVALALAILSIQCGESQVISSSDQEPDPDELAAFADKWVYTEQEADQWWSQRDAVVAPWVVTLPEQVALSAEVTDGAMLIPNAQASSPPKLERGDIVVSAHAEQPFMRRVNEIQQVDDGTLLETEPTHLNEIIFKGDLLREKPANDGSSTQQLVPESGSDNPDADEPIDMNEESSTSTKGTDGQSVKDWLSAGGSVTGSVEVGASATPFLTVDGGWHFDAQFEPIKQGIREAVTAQGFHYFSLEHCSSVDECQAAETCMEPRGINYTEHRCTVDWSDTEDSVNTLFADSLPEASSAAPSCGQVIAELAQLESSACQQMIEDYRTNAADELKAMLGMNSEQLTQFADHTNAFLNIFERQRLVITFRDDLDDPKDLSTSQNNEAMLFAYAAVWGEPGSSDEVNRKLQKVRKYANYHGEISNEHGCDNPPVSRAETEWAKYACASDLMAAEFDVNVNSVSTGLKDIFLGAKGSAGATGTLDLVKPGENELFNKGTTFWLPTSPPFPVYIAVSISVGATVNAAVEGKIGFELEPLKLEGFKFAGGFHYYRDAEVLEDTLYDTLVSDEDKARYDNPSDDYKFAEPHFNRFFVSTETEPFEFPNLKSSSSGQNVATSLEDALQYSASFEFSIEVTPRFQVLVYDSVGAFVEPFTPYVNVKLDSAAPYCTQAIKAGAKGRLGALAQIPLCDGCWSGEADIQIYDTCGHVCDADQARLCWAECFQDPDNCSDYQGITQANYVRLEVVSDITDELGRNSYEEHAEVDMIKLIEKDGTEHFPTEVALDEEIAADAQAEIDKLSSTTEPQFECVPQTEGDVSTIGNWQETCAVFKETLAVKFPVELEDGDRIRIQRIDDVRGDDGSALYLCSASDLLQVSLGDGNNWGQPAVGPAGDGFYGPTINIDVVESCSALQYSQACLKP